MECCAQFFYKIFEFEKVGKSAKKIACICSGIVVMECWAQFFNKILEFLKSAKKIACICSVIEVMECWAQFFYKILEFVKLENLPKKLHVYAV